MESLPNVNLFDAARLEREVTTFADDMCRASDFNEAVDEAEAWIVEHALSSRPGHDAEPQALACAESARAEVLGSARAEPAAVLTHRSGGAGVAAGAGEEPSCQP